MRSVFSVATFSLASAHYGDPYKLFGCEKDEIKVRINGVPGEFCSPPCNTDGSCPTDIPTGVTAKPGCVLTSSQGGQKYCALVCTPSSANPFKKPEDAQCGTHASCKKAIDNGLCTYDDAPKPPASAHWKPIISPTFDALSEALAVGFAPDGKTGFVGAGINGVGVEILKTVDSGVTWDSVWPDSNKTTFDLLLGAACKSEKSAVITGALFQEFTTDGNTFKGSLDDQLEPSQDAKVIKESGEYAIAVNGGKTNGVALSTTGYFWKNINMKGVDAATYPARYGAYPSATTWYLTAGTFPTNNSDAFKHVNSKLMINKKNGKYHVAGNGFDIKGSPPSAVATASAVDGFTAGIFKTTDKGASWTQVFKDVSNTIYPNGIDCISEDHCIAVVEGTNCQILVTTSGGKNWTMANEDTDAACSLTYVAMISETEAWVGGGHMAQFDFEGRFWHTTDGGKSWTKEAIKGVYIFDLDMQSASSGYAVALTQQSGVALFKYNPSGQ